MCIRRQALSNGIEFDAANARFVGAAFALRTRNNFHFTESTDENNFSPSPRCPVEPQKAATAIKDPAGEIKVRVK